MASHNQADLPRENLILSALPRDEYDRLIKKMSRVHLPQGTGLNYMGDILRHAYFINSGMVSLLSVAQNGSTIEVGMVGNEGMVGIPIILGMNETPYMMNVQIAVESAWKIGAEALREEFNRGGKFQELLLKYTHVVLTQLSQSALCNRFHTSEERLGRWLLVARDRVQSNTINLTQEIISHMLGIPRTGVTMTAGNLQKIGVISSRRGKITILDPKGLEDVACECYQVAKENLEHYLPNLARDSFVARGAYRANSG
jgi:CRP-like cAMP-binding protein